MVQRLLNRYGMKLYDFDGCAVGLKSSSGLPIRKPWTVATNHEALGNRLAQFRCKCTVKHQPGRGEDLKRTEEYTFKMTDAIHRILRARPTVACIPQVPCACCITRPNPILSAMTSIVTTSVDSVIMGYARSELGSVAERVALWEQPPHSSQRQHCLRNDQTISFQYQVENKQRQERNIHYHLPSLFGSV